MKVRVLAVTAVDTVSLLKLFTILNIPMNSIEGEELLHLGNRVELVFDVDTDTGKSQLVGAEGKFLGDEDIMPQEIHVEI